MSETTSLALWIGALAIGTAALRYGFFGAPGGYHPSRRVRRALDLAPAAIMCALAAPLIARDPDGAVRGDPVVLGAAAVTILVGAWARNFLFAVVAGLGALALGLSVFGA